ncbi:hypothetical protein NKI96_21180 [Mesorhizobium sp. M0292]|uniref:hypothetical protein n=1 Tax=Mesorhizobium sp. M0292 TaxID=2956929 RepID=UPI00333C37CA
MEDGIRLLELARKASRLFAKQPAHEFTPFLRQPFDLLAETVVAGAAMGAKQAALSIGSPVWLGFLEAFRTFWVAQQSELRVLMDKVGY